MLTFFLVLTVYMTLGAGAPLLDTATTAVVEYTPYACGYFLNTLYYIPSLPSASLHWLEQSCIVNAIQHSCIVEYIQKKPFPVHMRMFAHTLVNGLSLANWDLGLPKNGFPDSYAAKSLPPCGSSRYSAMGLVKWQEVLTELKMPIKDINLMETPNYDEIAEMMEILELYAPDEPELQLVRFMHFHEITFKIQDLIDQGVI